MGSHNVHVQWMNQVYIKNWAEDGSLEPKHVANYVLMILYIYIYIYIYTHTHTHTHTHIYIYMLCLNKLSHCMTQRDGSYQKFNSLLK